MPKFHTFPTLFDEIRSFSISDLKRLGYIHNPIAVSGVLQWLNRFDEVTSVINIYSHILKDDQYIQLHYRINGQTEYKYKVKLEALPSNLGDGLIWYFICSFTGKRCRKLHLINERFIHRSALPSGMYSKQTQSKKWRQMERLYGAYFDSDKVYQELYSKHFKRFYKGKPTKRYLKLMRKIKQSEKISHHDIERVMAFGI